MSTEVEFHSIKELYEAIADENSTSYQEFAKKLKRLAKSNPRTINSTSRKLGIEPKRKPAKRKPGEFIVYDGEGWDGKYTLLASKDTIGEPSQHYVNVEEGLSTVDCLEFLTLPAAKGKKRVFFSFGYDVNMILHDLSDDDLEIILRGESINYEGYRISYIPGKIFSVNGYKYYDCFSFFSTSFIRVVEKVLGKEFVTPSLIEGKKARAEELKTWPIEKIIAYNDEELDLLIQILNKLQAAFMEIGVNLTEWYGPGAVAKFWFKEHGVLPQEKHTPGSIYALNSAYYGGRFEQLSLGKFKNIYEYDIHSAYPSVMVDMPNFKSWKPVKEFIDKPYSLWYISFDLRYCRKYDWKDQETKEIDFMPLPVRGSDGRICFPLVGKGWYWYPEVKVMLDYFPDAKIIWHKGYVATVEGKPFGWIKELYDYRQSIKATGNLVEYAIKVGLNSLYGKCAQRVGSSPYFSLSWAGYITSATRAKLARAGYEGGSQNIIGFATDALFTTTPLNVSVSDNLGDWESSYFASGTFFQSGVYRLQTNDGQIIDRYRGSPLRAGIDDIIKQLKEHPYSYPIVKVARFISHMLAIKAPKAYGHLRLQFVRVDHHLALDAPYKRHYQFSRSVDKNGEVRYFFGVLLTRPVTSIPKVYVNDNNPFFTDDFLWSKRIVRDFESQAPAMSDRNTQLLLEDAMIQAVSEGHYDDVSSLDALPIVEDEMM